MRSLQNPHVVPTLSVNINTWQGWRDSNPHPPDLESGALAVRATPLFSSEGTAARSEASPTADCDGKAAARTPMEPPLERGEVTPWSTVSTRRYFVSLCGVCLRHHRQYLDRKSTRLNSSHLVISYAVFCLKKKKNKKNRLGSFVKMT